MDGSDVLQTLWDDHRVSAHLLGVMGRELPAACRGDSKALQRVLAIAEREAEYGDRVHHAREELLFSRLASRGASGAEAVAGLAHDHNELVRMGTGLRELLGEIIAGREHDGELLQARAIEFADALRNHMRKEERRAFALAPQYLTALDWEIVAGAYASSIDPLAPPAAERYRALEAWLEEQGEVVFEGRPL